mmetsp:Transcript_11776/g.18488  ORF Transcript_11776/g.18488 Transcript_11776/m.18488 type:complete len:239 (-) Transcript_11776:1082-1798(-)
MDFVDRTTIYHDRSRFRCIGTPLRHTQERLSMSMRSGQRHSVQEVAERTKTPLIESFHAKEPWSRQETILKRHGQTALARRTGQMRLWSSMADRAEAGDQESARRVDVEGYGSKVSVIYKKDRPTEEQTKYMTDVMLDHQEKLDPEEAYRRKRPLATYSKLEFSGQTFLVAQTANNPTERRIFMQTHYSPWEGKAIGIRAPGPGDTSVSSLGGSRSPSGNRSTSRPNTAQSRPSTSLW